MIQLCKGFNNISTQSLLNPLDKQNVPCATELLFRVINFREGTAENFPFRLSQVVASGIKLLGIIAKEVIVQYAYVLLYIQEILEAISSAAHVLLVVYRKYATSCMPNQLYNDLMVTFRDVYICATKYKEDKPEEPYITSLGTDGEENYYFNLLRATHNSGSLDAMEIDNRSQWIHAVVDVLWGPPRLETNLFRCC